MAAGVRPIGSAFTSSSVNTVLTCESASAVGSSLVTTMVSSWVSTPMVMFASAT